LSLLGAQNELMGFIDFAGEVLIVCQKLLEINSSVLIKEHTSNSWSELLAKGLLNKTIDAVSDELRDSLWVSIKLLKFVDVNLWQLDFGHLAHLNLLWCSWLLLLLHVHLLLICSALHWWYRHAALHIHLTSLLVVHSSVSSSWLIRIMLLIHVLILVVITSTLVSITTSASVVSLTSSSILVLLCSVIVIPVLLLTTLVVVWSPHLIHWVVISVILSLKINELQNVLLGHGVILLFNIYLGSPEIDFNWSSEAKDVGFMIVLDTFLGLLHILV